MSEITEALTAKVGGLPAWAWGLGLGGVIVAWQRFRTPPAPDVEPEPDPELRVVTGGAPGDEFTLSPSPMGGGTFAVAPRVSDNSTANEPAIASNSTWKRVATDWAIGAGFDPIVAQSALERYLSGSSPGLDRMEAAVVTAVLRQFGAPPQGAPAVILKKVAPDVNRERRRREREERERQREREREERERQRERERERLRNPEIRRDRMFPNPK